MGGVEVPGGPDPATAGNPAVSMEAMRQDFLDFFEAEYHPVVRFMMRNDTRLTEAQDAAQEAFVRAWRMVLSCRWSEVRHPRAWVRTVALNYHRSQRWNAVLIDHPPDSPTSGPGHAELIGQAIDAVVKLNLIGDDAARAVLALDMDDIPGPAIATGLRLTEQQVRDLRKKARRTLKKYVRSQSQLTAQTPQPEDADRREAQ